MECELMVSRRGNSTSVTDGAPGSREASRAALEDAYPQGLFDDVPG